MDNTTKNPLTDVRLDQMIALTQLIGRTFQFIADFCFMYADALSDLKRMRSAIKSGRTPAIILHEFLNKISDERIAEYIERSNVVKFELGKMWIETRTPEDRAHINLCKSLIQSKLKEQYGIDFTLKIR